MKKLMFFVLFLILYQSSITYANQFKKKIHSNWNTLHLFITNETKDNHQVQPRSVKNDEIFKIPTSPNETQFIPTIMENVKQNELTSERKNENFISSTSNANILINTDTTIDLVIKPEKEKLQTYSTTRENMNIDFKTERRHENFTNFNTTIKNSNTANSTITISEIAKVVVKRNEVVDDSIKYKLESFDETNAPVPFPTTSNCVQPTNQLLLNALSLSLIFKLYV